MGCEMIHCVDGSISCELMELHTAACTAVAAQVPFLRMSPTVELRPS